MHDERYIISISDDHNTVRLRDQKVAFSQATFIGAKALYDALGILAEWRERDQAHGTDAPIVIVDGDGDKWVLQPDGRYRFMNGSECRSIESIREAYGIREMR